MEKRLTYKIGEKCGATLWQWFCDSWVSEIEIVFDSVEETISNAVKYFEKLFDELRHVKKPKMPKPPKVIRPKKTAPHFAIIPHARTRC